MRAQDGVFRENIIFKRNIVGDIYMRNLELGFLLVITLQIKIFKCCFSWVRSWRLLFFCKFDPSKSESSCFGYKNI